MKSKSLLLFSSLMAFVLLVGLACSFGTTATPVPPTPIQAATQPPQQATQPPQVTQPPAATQPPSNSNGSGDLQTFTDKNNFYQIQVPSDWTYKQVTGDNYYIDQFKSPDEQALVENIAYNDGTPFTGSQNGQFALKLLNQFYSNTGQEGDIRVSSDQIQPDKSERLEWTSKSGGYSGASYFEIRGGDRMTFLMITIEWVNSAQDQYLDILNSVIKSYTTP